MIGHMEAMGHAWSNCFLAARCQADSIAESGMVIDVHVGKDGQVMKAGYPVRPHA
jgi:hypothetical protein